MSLFQIDAGREWRSGQRQAFLLTRELAGCGYPATLVVQPGSPLQDKAKAANLRVLPVEIKTDAHLRAGWKIGRAMRRESCVLAHFHDDRAAGVGGRAARRANVPIRIVTRRAEFPLKANPISRNKYADVDAVIAVSQRVREVLEKGGVPADRIEVIPSGIDLGPFAENSDKDFLRREFGFSPDSFLVGIVAHLVDGKGHRTLIEAAKFLKSHLSKIKIIIIGGGALELELAEQARGLGVGDLVFFLGFRDDVPRLLASLDAFVLTSDAEGLGTSIMDAMAARLPVVATRVGGLPEVVADGETGLLIPPGHPEELAKAIFGLYTDRALAERLGNRGFEVVRRKFSAEAMVFRIVDLYEKIAERKKIKLKA
ncbi:MAG: glycosyltransferase family 4 protein [Candidatus Aminicenantes bacterium]|nr:glycosyltransferase family 4 protein [Candidatus Aminicenantes bacterium]